MVSRPPDSSRRPRPRRLPDLPDPARNVFLMIRFRSTEVHEFLTRTIRSALAQYGLNLVRADMRDYHEILFENVRICMDGCDYGIAVFETIDGQVTSPNVSLELGYMLAKARPCLLLKDRSVSFVQADLAGHLYQEFDVEAIPETVPPPIRKWLQDLGFTKRSDERLVVFVSHGGTCRDPMAKAITEVLLRGHSPGFKIRLEGGALGPPSRDEVSDAARRAVKNMFGEDLLSAYRPSMLSRGLIEDADLILVMSESMLQPKVLPPEKTYLLKRFFGSSGDVADPWPDGDDEKANKRYTQCAEELRGVIEPNVESLIEFLEPR